MAPAGISCTRSCPSTGLRHRRRTPPWGLPSVLWVRADARVSAVCVAPVSSTAVDSGSWARRRRLPDDHPLRARCTAGGCAARAAQEGALARVRCVGPPLPFAFGTGARRPCADGVVAGGGCLRRAAQMRTASPCQSRAAAGAGTAVRCGSAGPSTAHSAACATWRHRSCRTRSHTMLSARPYSARRPLPLCCASPGIVLQIHTLATLARRSLLLRVQH